MENDPWRTILQGPYNGRPHLTGCHILIRRGNDLYADDKHEEPPANSKDPNFKDKTPTFTDVLSNDIRKLQSV